MSSSTTSYPSTFLSSDSPYSYLRADPPPFVLTSEDIVSIPFPIPAYSGNSFYTAVGPMVGLVMTMSMLYPVSRLIKAIVEEKETRSKETMKMMGLLDWVFATSWFITYFCVFTFIAFVISGLLAISVLGRTNFSLLFFFFWIFVTSQITFSFLVSVFFSRAKLAGIVGPILVFVTVMPRYAFFSSENNDMIAQKTGASLLSPTAFAFGADLLMQYEGANLGMTYANLRVDEFSFFAILSMMIIDIFVYGFLAWYLEHVLPNMYGSRKVPWFCCLRSYWCPNRPTTQQSGNQELYQVLDDEGDVDKVVTADNVEPIGSDYRDRRTVSLRKLRKVYSEGTGINKKETVAVVGLDLDLYEGQITALLGHNGAGKTTTISILTGLLEATSGKCIINGLDIGKDMSEIRKNLGICPQHNVLFSTLSVYEHLALYATLKGVPQKEIETSVNEIIVEVGLADKKFAHAGALSGGMQRKLSVAIALIGGSKVVFLDEPTSGMDPYARRATWELLRKNKEDRCLILTTHFMDEADLLGDRIAIMADGQLKCVGSSLFLKARYGIGYNLTMVKQDGRCDANEVTEMVRNHVPQAAVLSTAGGEMAFQLPLESVGQFAPLFQELETRRQDMAIGGYGISMTTLEEVFMRITSDMNVEMKKTSFSEIEKKRRAQSISVNMESQTIEHEQTIGIATQYNEHDEDERDEDEQDVYHSKSEDGKKEPLLKENYDYRYNREEGRELDMETEYKKANSAPRKNSLWRQFVELLRKRYITAIRDIKGRFFEVILPVIVVAVVLLILKMNVNPAGPSIQLDTFLYSGTQDHTKARTAGVSGGVADVPFAEEMVMKREPLVFYYLSQTDGLDFIPLNNVTDSLNMSLYLLDTYDDHEGVDRYISVIYNDTIYAQLNFSRLDNSTIVNLNTSISLLHNSTFFHAIPAFSSALTISRIRALLNWTYTSLNQTGPEVQTLINNSYCNVQNHPLPLTSSESMTIQTFLSLFAGLFILIPFCYLPASFVIFVVKERSVKAKHLQLVSGVNPNMYWLANYAWDVINFLFVTACCMIVFKAYGNSEFVGSLNKSMGTMVIIILYGVSSLPLSYLYSFIFQNHTSAQVGIAGLHFLFGFVLVIASFILDSIESTHDANQTLKYFYRISPPFNLGEGLVNICTIDLMALYSSDGSKASAFDWDISGRSLTYLGSTAVGFFILVLLIDNDVFAAIPRLFIRCSFMFDALCNRATQVANQFDPKDIPQDEDEDVGLERSRISSVTHSESKDVVLIQNLRKIYQARGGRNPTVAVHNLCLGIPRGQCFGFLGVNGAGKTTTLKMLTGDTEVSYGNAYINGYSILQESEEVRKHIGYCPQFNPLLDLMTGREQIAMYARFRGIPEEYVSIVVKKLLKKLGLQKYADKTAGSYSGGNMRKLSLALALVGEPSVVFLDEPSTGMDPVSRRFMWNVIASVTQNKSLILTTHSMEECEALCGRIGIMVSGKLRCLGSIQHLKSRFGKGYHMEINTTEKSFAKVKAFVEKLDSGAVLEEFHAGRLKYRLSQSNNLTLSTIFGSIEKAKVELEIDDYSLSQSTLEQIFLLMAAQDRDNEGQHIDAASL